MGRSAARLPKLLPGLSLVASACLLAFTVSGCSDSSKDSTAKPAANSGAPVDTVAKSGSSQAASTDSAVKTSSTQASDASATPDTGATPAPSGTKRIVLLINGSSSYWETGRAGMNQAAKDLDLEKNGLSVGFEVNDGTEQAQLDKLRQFGAESDIVGLAISPVKPNNLAVVREMEKLQAKGVHVICMDSDIDRAKYRKARLAYIGTDNSKAGEVLGDAAKRLLDARKAPAGGYIDFVGYLSAQNALDRMDAIKKVLSGPYKELDRMEDRTDRGIAKSNVRTALENYPDVQALFGIWSYNAPQIGDVVGREVNAERRSKLTVATFDCEPNALVEMKKGNIDVMVVQNPFDIAYESVKLLKALATDDKATVSKMLPNLGKEGGDIYDTDIRVVVPNDKSPLKAEMFKKYGPIVQFFTLPEFNDWLKQRGLTGS